MVSFHQESQRLAVGTHHNVIIVYDLRTGTKYHVLEGHTSSLTSVSFSASGKYLVSYALDESKVRFWSTSTGLFGLVNNPHCIQINNVPKSDKQISSLLILKSLKTEWTSGSSVQLTRPYDTQPIIIGLKTQN